MPIKAHVFPVHRVCIWRHRAHLKKFHETGLVNSILNAPLCFAMVQCTPVIDRCELPVWVRLMDNLACVCLCVCLGWGLGGGFCRWLSKEWDHVPVAETSSGGGRPAVLETLPVCFCRVEEHLWCGAHPVRWETVVKSSYMLPVSSFFKGLY